VKEMREKENGVLVLDAGDLLFKKFSNAVPENELKMVTQKAQLIIESFNLMRYDAVGVGDDDLTLGKEFLLEMSKKAHFPFLSSNLLDEASGNLLLQPYILKEINGLRIGIFSLLSPDVFAGDGDPRKKGLGFRPPIETAQNMVKELQPKTDLIILLSHLSYPKDVELAQKVTGIHLILSSHTGIHLTYPPPIKNTVIVQTAPKGMYAGRLNLVLHNNESTFYNTMTKRALENNLNNLNNRLNSPQASEAEKTQWRKTKEDTERSLGQFHGKNEFTNMILPLNDQVKDHPNILKMVEEYRSKSPETGQPFPPK
jgi:2',3'-cyclic-nucleotide 2'-phosphodiesterase (5'-nucleotidase family)